MIQLTLQTIADYHGQTYLDVELTIDGQRRQVTGVELDQPWSTLDLLGLAIHRLHDEYITDAPF